VAEFLFCISRFIGFTHRKVNNGSSLWMHIRHYACWGLDVFILNRRLLCQACIVHCFVPGNTACCKVPSNIAKRTKHFAKLIHVPIQAVRILTRERKKREQKRPRYFSQTNLKKHCCCLMVFILLDQGTRDVWTLEMGSRILQIFQLLHFPVILLYHMAFFCLFFFVTACLMVYMVWK